MSWNYRIIKKQKDEYISYGIYEVYYDKDGSIKSWSADPMYPFLEIETDFEKDDVQGLKDELHRMDKAFSKPILMEGYVNGKLKLMEV